MSYRLVELPFLLVKPLKSVPRKPLQSSCLMDTYRQVLNLIQTSIVHGCITFLVSWLIERFSIPSGYLT